MWETRVGVGGEGRGERVRDRMRGIQMVAVEAELKAPVKFESNISICVTLYVTRAMFVCQSVVTQSSGDSLCPSATAPTAAPLELEAQLDVVTFSTDRVRSL
jgi:hypothetical protein